MNVTITDTYDDSLTIERLDGADNITLIMREGDRNTTLVFEPEDIPLLAANLMLASGAAL